MKKTVLTGMGIACLAMTSMVEPASANTCEVSYGIAGSSFTTTTGFINLGNVAFPGMKGKCKTKATNNCQRAEVKTLVQQYAPVGSANFQSICTSGGVTIYMDTQVDGRERSRDGTCRFTVSCVRPPCPFTGYSSLQDLEGLKLARAESDPSGAGCEMMPRPL